MRHTAVKIGDRGGGFNPVWVGMATIDDRGCGKMLNPSGGDYTGLGGEGPKDSTDSITDDVPVVKSATCLKSPLRAI